MADEAGERFVRLDNGAVKLFKGSNKKQLSLDLFYKACKDVFRITSR